MLAETRSYHGNGPIGSAVEYALHSQPIIGVTVGTKQIQKSLEQIREVNQGGTYLRRPETTLSSRNLREFDSGLNHSRHLNGFQQLFVRYSQISGFLHVPCRAWFAGIDIADRGIDQFDHLVIK